MNVLFLYKEDYPWDVRVQKIIETLTELGHNVQLVCRNVNRSPIEEHTDAAHIFRLPQMLKFPKSLHKAANMPFFFNPVWFWAVMRAARGERPDVIIVRDLPLMVTGLIAARVLGSRLIFDMAECYPEMYRAVMDFTQPSVWTRLLKNPSVASFYERIMVRAADHTFVMIEESRDRLIKRGASPERLSIVSNTPRDITQRKATDEPHAETGLRLIYVGFVTEIRGLDVTIEGIYQLLQEQHKKTDIRFDIVGVGSAQESLNELVLARNMEPYVNIHGWLEHSEVAMLLNNADVGVLTYRICGHWNHTIPNKLFDYMAAGIPVLATPVRPIQRIVNETNCGLICDERDPRDVARKIATLQDAEYRNRLGINGRHAIENKYNWTNDKERLVRALEK